MITENILNKIDDHLYTKMVKTKEKTFFFDVRKGKRGKKYITIMKCQKGTSNINEKSITLWVEEIDLILKSLKELKPLLQ